MAVFVGQVIAIDVLTRHITTSSGKCQTSETSLTTDCVMADALRDRFPGATNMSVGTGSADFTLPDGRVVSLHVTGDMQSAINRFDDVIEGLRLRRTTLRDAIRAIRTSIPRVVHATVREVYDVGY
jgi:hypothetical protein